MANITYREDLEVEPQKERVYGAFNGYLTNIWRVFNEHLTSI